MNCPIESSSTDPKNSSFSLKSTLSLKGHFPAMCLLKSVSLLFLMLLLIPQSNQFSNPTPRNNLKDVSRTFCDLFAQRPNFIGYFNVDSSINAKNLLHNILHCTNGSNNILISSTIRVPRGLDRINSHPLDVLVLFSISQNATVRDSDP